VLLGIVLGAAATALAPGARAVDYVFSPTLDLFLFKDGNPRVVGEDAVSQDVARAQLGLAFETLTPRTEWGLDYRLYHEKFRDDTILDNTGHLLYTTVKHEISRRSDMSARVFASRTPRQMIYREVIDVPDSLVPRTSINRAYVDVKGKVETGARNFVTWRAGGGLQHFEETPEVEYNDSDQLIAGAGWGRNVSRRASVGLAYLFRHISYETTPSLNTNTLAVTSRVELTEKMNFTGALGAVRLEREDGESDSTVSFDLRINRELDRYNDLRFGVRRLVSPGFGIGGATLDEGGFVGWRYRSSRLWWADVNATYWHRERIGSNPTRGTEGFRTFSSIWWTPLQHLGFGIFHSYTNQNNLDPTSSTSDTAYNTGGFSMRWDILGNSYKGLRRGR